jgi:hypothetical protein
MFQYLTIILTTLKKEFVRKWNYYRKTETKQRDLNYFTTIED